MSDRCRNGHDLTLPEATVSPAKPGGRRRCRECRRVAHRKYNKTAKAKAMRERWLEGLVVRWLRFDPEAWAEFRGYVGEGKVNGTLNALLRRYNAEQRERMLRRRTG